MPMFLLCWRKIFTPKEWKVEIHIFSVSCPKILFTRSNISVAALLVKVIASMLCAWVWLLASR